MRCQLAQHRVFPRLEIIELFVPEDANLMGPRQRTTFFERGTFGHIALCMSVRNHQHEIRVFETGKPHGVCDRARRGNAQILLPLTNIFQINRRRKTGISRKITPRKRRCALTFIVVVLDELAIVRIFDDFLHRYKYRYFLSIREYKNCVFSQNLPFLPFLLKFSQNRTQSMYSRNTEKPRLY